MRSRRKRQCQHDERWRITMLGLAITLAPGAGCEAVTPARAGRTVKVGLVMPMSGPAAIGPWDNSAQLAINEINQAGGIDDQRLELLTRDSREGLPAGGDVVRAAIADLADAGVAVVLGPGFSSSLITARETIVARRIPVIGLSTTSPSITTLADDDLVFRVVPSDTFQGAALAHRVRSDGFGTLAVIHVDDIYGAGLAMTLRNRFEQEGGRVTIAVPYPVGKARDFEAEVARLFEAGHPGAIALVGTSIESAAIVAALAARDPVPKPALYGVDGNATEVFLANAPPQYVVGMRGTTSASPVDRPAFMTFAAAYRGALGADPMPGLENAYDAVYLAALAMLQARQTTPAAVKAELRAVSRPDSPAPIAIGIGSAELAKAAANPGADLDFHGASGAIDFDAAGDVSSGTYRIWEIVETPEGLRFVDRDHVGFP